MNDESDNTAVVFISHTLAEPVRSRFEKLRRETPPSHDVFFLYDASETSESRLQSAREAIGENFCSFRPSEILDVPYPNSWADPSEKGIVPGNVDLLFLHSWEEVPSYSHYWFIEYDVAYSGSWTEFFRTFRRSNASLLGTTLTPYEYYTDWYWWPRFSPPPEIDRSNWLRGFFPIIRLSSEALVVLDEGYRSGWSGHYEAVIPTVLRNHGLQIEDIGGDGPFVKSENVNKHYSNTPGRESLSPGSFVYRPVRPRAGPRSDYLWHPVKPNSGRVLPYLRLLKHRLSAFLPRVAKQD